MRLYLAGPMTGYPEFNFPAFRHATASLRRYGFEVFDPSELDEQQGFDPTGLTGHEQDIALRRQFLAADLEWICLHADGVALLKGWQHSTGARAEVATAKALGLPWRRWRTWINEAKAINGPTAIDAAHLERQRAWSLATFGPGMRTGGVTDHIRKELAEVEADPTDLSEWVDVTILALDGAWRAGHEPQEIIDAIHAKQRRNERRQWPDWRAMSEDVAIEHVEEAP